MTFLERVTADIASAMRAKDQVRLAPLRMLTAALMNREVEKGRPLDEPESLQVVSALIKQRRDSIEQFQRGGRQDLADRESAEIGQLQSYLPPPLDQSAIERAVDAAIAEAGATSSKDMGRVMKIVMPKLSGAAVEGRTVNEIVRRKLG